MRMVTSILVNESKIETIYEKILLSINISSFPQFNSLISTLSHWSLDIVKATGRLQQVLIAEIQGDVISGTVKFGKSSLCAVKLARRLDK